MDQNKKKIVSLIYKIYSQNEVPHWSVADEQLLCDIALGREPILGKRKNILKKIVIIANKLHLTDIVIFIFGLLHTLYLWSKINRKSKKQKTNFEKIFAGFGAHAEDSLYENYISKTTQPVLRINWSSYEGVQELGYLSLIPIISLLFKYSFGHTNKLKTSLDEISSNLSDFITIFMANISTYCIYRVFWRRAKLCGVTEVAVLAADIPAHAAVEEGLNTVYLVHGLMTLSILIPKFNRIEVVTEQEKNFLSVLLPQIKIEKTKVDIQRLKERNNVLMILSLDVFQKSRLLDSEQIVQWANKHKLKIVIRPTNTVTPEQLTILAKTMPNATIDDSHHLSFNQSFDKWKPKYVVAWTSTTLATSLDYGSIPISLHDPCDIKVWSNMIYPMRNRVLFWFFDREKIEKTMTSDSSYLEQLKSLQNSTDLDSNFVPDNSNLY